MAISDEARTQQGNAAPHPIDIEAWTEQATAAMGSVSISAVPVAVPQAEEIVVEAVSTSRTVTLAIPLDAEPAAAKPEGASAAARSGGQYARREPLRRDSLKRREALLKGKEGSRQRRRWENDRLLNNPHAEPPTPRDWEVHPTHRVAHVPYYLAPLWDAGLRRQHNERKSAAIAQKTASRTVAKKPTSPGVVPKELREKLKRSRGAKGLLMDLEAEVRRFVEDWEEKERRAERDGLPADPVDSEDEEIVFVGRNGVMHDHGHEQDQDQDGAVAQRIKRELMLFETPEDDAGGTFGRWLVHHIAIYYGLNTWSVTVGDPARREAYIGLKDERARMRTGGKMVGGETMPRPLWGMV